MTDEQITFIVGWPTEPEMVKFRLVALAAELAERERCAKVCDNELPPNAYAPMSTFNSGKYVMAEYLAAAIRKGPTP